MKDLRSLLLLALAALVNAQSAPGFPIQVDTNLRVDYQTSSTSIKEGALLNRDGEYPTLLKPQHTLTNLQTSSTSPRSSAPKIQAAQSTTWSS